MDLTQVLAVYQSGREILASPQTWGVNTFPDGQLQFKINKNCVVQEPVALICCLKTAEATDVCLQAVYTFRQLGVLASTAIVWYYGSRSDKDATDQEFVCNVSQYIGAKLGGTGLEVKTLKILDPHHVKGPGLWTARGPFGVNPEDYGLVVYPDESAEERYRYTSISDLPNLTCKKVRDQQTGQIVDYAVPPVLFRKEGPRMLVADDICDGGATFIKLAEKYRFKELEVKVDLCVTHGLFSNNAIERLHEAGYDRLFTTNSCHRHLRTIGRTIVTDVWRPQDPRLAGWATNP